jgi:(S)-3,5-dihydroxyphenylglycine transaminase
MQLQPPATLQDPNLDVMNFLNEVTLWYPSAISFAPGRPIEQFFDVQASLAYISAYAQHEVQHTGQSSTTMLNRLGQYQKTNGIINDLLCQFLANDEHIQTTPDAVMLTDGCQEGMTILLAGLFERDRDVLLVIDPTYTGIIGIASVLGVTLYPVPGDWSGINVDQLERAIEDIREQGKNPRALYVTPDFNNPLGTSMSIDDRQRLLALAAEHQMLIFEDNAYGMFAYDGAPLPTLKSLDREGVVIYLGTFSKILFPALRLGFLVADQVVESSGQEGTHYLAGELSKVKSFTTVSTSGLLQAIAGGVLLETGCSLRKRVQEKTAFYRANRDMMLACLEETFGQDPILAERVIWNHPQGGFFLSVSLPFAFTKERMQACAEEYGVICCPMSFFSLLGGCQQQVRLSFSYVTGDAIKKGVFQFWQFVHDTMAMED